MKYSAILFDADGLTILSNRFSDRMQADYGTSWETMKPFFDGPFAQCKLGKADLKEELATVLPNWNWPGTIDGLLAYWFKDTTVNPAIIELIYTLQDQGAACYLATNQENYRAHYLRNTLNLGEIFNGFFISAEMGHTKDEPAFFEEVIDQLAVQGISSEQILFIDHEAKNLEAAQKAGLETYAYHDIANLQAFLEEA